MSKSQLTAKAFELRQDVLDLVYRAKTGHIGGDFSVMEILVALYYDQLNNSPGNMNDPNRDRFVLSKGHSVESLYTVLADCGFFPKEELLTFSQFGSKYIGHPTNKINGIEVNSGSLGHGLSVCVGMALAGRMSGLSYRVYTVMGDGELAEGSVWEGAMAGGHYKLANLTAIIDRNRLQISGGTEDVMAQDNQDLRWSGFGWNVIHVEGNNVSSVIDGIKQAKAFTQGPSVIIADTTKGYGVSFMENQASWHHKVPTPEQYEQAKKELAERAAMSK